MSSIKDVAKLAGVSIATVSRYLSDPESIRENNRGKVARAIAQTGYTPNALARNFRRGKTSLVLVLLPNIGIPLFSGVMKGISQVAEDEGYSLMIRETEKNTLNWDEYSAMVLSKQADGIILLASISPYTAPAEPAPGSRQLPIVLCMENLTEELSRFPSVRIDNLGASIEATNYLANLGHRKIAFISGRGDTTLMTFREDGYLQAMRAANLPVPRGYIVEGNLDLDDARKATRKLLSHPSPPTAIFCANDEMAMGCIHEIKTAGLRVPEDISVMGFDDIHFAAVMDPPLTTVAQPAEEIGERTMLRLTRAINGMDIGVEAEVVPHKLVVRRSTCSPEDSCYR